jgi:hypothetical protein
VLGGYGVQNRKFGSEDLLTTTTGTVQKVSGVLTIGQNNPKAFYGVKGSIDQTITQTNSVQLVRNLSALSLFFGIRF